MEIIKISIIALISCLAIGLLLYPLYIKYLNSRMVLQTVSEYATEEFKNKPKVPIFGGVIFIGLAIIATLLFNSFSNLLTMRVLAFVTTLFLYFLIGFVDDYRIVKYSRNEGLKEIHKFLLQLFAALIVFIVFKDWFYFTLFGINMPIYVLIPFGMFMLTGFSNAVNITDGIDGLSSSTVVLSLITWWFVILIKGDFHDLLIPITCLIGGLMAYFIYNHKPAKIYMGDCGSLSLGASFALLGFMIDLSLLAILIGIVFVIETASVMIQVFSVKVFKRKVFLYTPIHYTFTLKGWGENQVVCLFNMIGLVGSALALLIVCL